MLYIAYTREDALFAIQIADDLAALGVDVWLDLKELGPDIDWAAAQQGAIAASEGLIVILSAEAIKREHMQTEIRQAFETGKRVYLAVAQRTPWRSWLEGLPVADFTTDYEAGLDALVLNILGDGAAQDQDEAADDEAARWLRMAAQERQSTAPPAVAKAPPPASKSLFSRLRRR